MSLFGVTVVVLVVFLCMKRRQKLERRSSDEQLNTAYRGDSECEHSIWDEQDTVYEIVRKRQIIDKVKSGFRRPVENVGCS